MSSASYFSHKGLLFPKADIFTAEFFTYVEDEFQLLDDDVVSVVYPKSGRKGNGWHARAPADALREKGKDRAGGLDRITQCGWAGCYSTCRNQSKTLESAMKNVQSRYQEEKLQ